MAVRLLVLSKDALSPKIGPIGAEQPSRGVISPWQEHPKVTKMMCFRVKRMIWWMQRAFLNEFWLKTLTRCLLIHSQALFIIFVPELDEYLRELPIFLCKQQCKKPFKDEHLQDTSSFVHGEVSSKPPRTKCTTDVCGLSWLGRAGGVVTSAGLQYWPGNSGHGAIQEHHLCKWM